MTFKIQLQEQSFVWVSIEEINIFSETKNIIENTGKFICYLKFSENSPFLVLGEPLKDKNNNPLIFNSYKEAIEYVKKLTTKLQIL